MQLHNNESKKRDKKTVANNDKEVNKKCQQDKRIRRISGTTNRKRM